MSNMAIILGESGTGKSTSIRNLNPKETFIINIVNKPLPFRGYKKNYVRIKSWDDREGNYYSSDDYTKIIRMIDEINNNRPEITTLIIDDFQYMMANEFMRKALIRGFDKFSEIAQHSWMVMEKLQILRDDLDCFLLTHSEPNEHGKMKLKTVGNLTDKMTVLEGRFTWIFQTEINDGKYQFVTQGNSKYIAKTPMGAFEDLEIPNDLTIVKKAMHDYELEDIAS